MFAFFKMIHLLGVIMFIGNIVVTGYWKFKSDLTRDAKIIAFSSREVMLTDCWFTLPGVILTLIGGGMLTHMGGFLTTSARWLNLAIGLYILSGILWAFVLIPCQRRMVALSLRAVKTGQLEEYYSVARLWYIVGLVATLLPVSNIYLMVVKPF